MRGVGWEKSVAVSPGAVIGLVESRIQVGEVSCRTFQTAIKGECPMIIQFIAQIRGRIEETGTNAVVRNTVLLSEEGKV